MTRLLPILLFGCSTQEWLIDVDRLEAESLRTVEASPECLFMEAVATPEEALQFLEALPQDHRQCRRCAGKTYSIFVDLSRRQERFLDEDERARLLLDFAFRVPFEVGEFAFLTGVRLQEALGQLGFQGADACRFDELRLEGRLAREGMLRTKWAEAETLTEADLDFRGLAGLFQGTAVGRAFEEFASSLEDDRLDRVAAAARRIVDLAEGTPFADAAWFTAVMKAAREDVAAAERLWAERTSSRFTAATLYSMAFLADDGRLARLQLEKYSHWEWDAKSHALLAKFAAAGDREQEMLAHAHLVLDLPPVPRSTTILGARSDVGRVVAEFRESRGQWAAAIDAWLSWRLYAGWCGNAWLRMEERRWGRILSCIMEIAGSALPSSP